jgi:hypothetical protein
VGGEALLVAMSIGSAAGQTTTRVSVGSAGLQGNAFSSDNALSADGRYVAFRSHATNLVAGDTNGLDDVFVYDRSNGTLERASVDSGGAQSNGTSALPAISGDGRYVAFMSNATNLVVGDTNNVFDVFVRDRTNGTTELVSVSSAGVQANAGIAQIGVSISGDGRYVAFTTLASNLVAGDTNNTSDVFIRDRIGGTTERVSVSSAGAQGNSFSNTPAWLSADGRYVIFGSSASNLVSGDTGFYDVFVRDRVNGTTERVSVDSAGAQANGNSGYFGLAISSDGRYAVFQSVASNLVTGDTNANWDVFVRDRTSGTTERVSIDSAGVQGNYGSGTGSCLSISADGRYVAFRSDATNLVPGDTNANYDAFIRDRTSGTTERVSVSSTGAQASGASGSCASLSADGRYVSFESSAADLVAGDTNGAADVFVHENGGSFPGPYCTAGTTTNGCLASIAGTGTPSASSGSGFTLSVSAVEGQKQGLLFYGIDNTAFAPAPWGASTSYLCIKPPTQRTPAQSSGGTAGACDGALSIDWNLFRATTPGVLGLPFAAGQHVFAQGWFRDPPSPKTTNLSNALEFVVGP